MPLTTTVGLCKKVGLPDYGSLGATCHVEFELDAALIQQDLDTFHQQVQAAFIACSQAVQDELTRQSGPPATQQNHSPTPPVNGSSRHRFPGNNHTPRIPAGASDKQMAYAQRLASQIPDIGLNGLDDLAQQLFANPLATLSAAEASRLIDTLKAVKSGQIQPRDFFAGASS